MRLWPAESDNNRFVAALDFLLAVVAFLDEHSEEELCLHGLELCDASLVRWNTMIHGYDCLAMGLRIASITGAHAYVSRRLLICG